jgi:pimeloyl-ACP methyl ester carboxylesterase
VKASFSERYWTTADGLKLYYRDYVGQSDKSAILCLHGLTRNSRDFACLAEELGSTWRLIVPEMRGRGKSDYANDTNTYLPSVYIDDVKLLIESLQMSRFIVLGTSMGGRMAMLMADHYKSRMKALILNDIGPEVEVKGIERILGYVGHGRSYDTWVHAAKSLRDSHNDCFPKYKIDDWLDLAKRTMILGQNGRVILDYDMGIAEPYRLTNASEQPSLWESFASLTSIPMLVLRGELSDLLSERTVARMLAEHNGLRTVTVPMVGHAPSLAEPEAVEAIKRFLKQID